MAEVSALAGSLCKYCRQFLDHRSSKLLIPCVGRTMSMDSEEEDENVEPVVGNPEIESMVRQVFSLPKEEQLIKGIYRTESTI